MAPRMETLSSQMLGLWCDGVVCSAYTSMLTRFTGGACALRRVKRDSIWMAVRQKEEVCKDTQDWKLQAVGTTSCRVVWGNGKQ